MALIKCDECGRDVSDKAVSCPNCGNPITDSYELDEVDALNKVDKPIEATNQHGSAYKSVSSDAINGSLVFLAVVIIGLIAYRVSLFKKETKELSPYIQEELLSESDSKTLKGLKESYEKTCDEKKKDIRKLQVILNDIVRKGPGVKFERANKILIDEKVYVGKKITNGWACIYLTSSGVPYGYVQISSLIESKTKKTKSKTKKKPIEYSTAGEWCYEPLPGNPKFNMFFQISKSSGTANVTISFGSGGATTSSLTELSPGTFIINDSPSGDKFVVDKRTGNLGVYDSTGFVGTAYRKSKNSCFQ
jgi:hypothetical protein